MRKQAHFHQVFFCNLFEEPMKTTKQMTTRTKRSKVGAVVHSEVDWNQLNWCRINNIVNRLQRRIAEAQKQGRYGKVKSLQYLLTRSFSAKWKTHAN
jgi:RNA-directed DNA polymerase